MSIIIGVQRAKRQGWDDLLDLQPPRNYTDQAKIDKWLVDAKAKAVAGAADNQVLGRIDSAIVVGLDCKIVTADGKDHVKTEVTDFGGASNMFNGTESGSAMLGFLDALLWYDESAGHFCRKDKKGKKLDTPVSLVGIDTRNTLRQAAITSMANGVAPPQWITMLPSVAGRRNGLVNVESLISTAAEFPKLRRLLGIELEDTAESQVKFCSELLAKVGFVR